MSPSAGRAWTRARPWAAASLPFVFLVVWFWDRGPGLDADDYGLTLMHAEALVEGRPYWDTGYIATQLDLAPPTQPPGLPLLVAGAMVVGGEDNLSAIRTVMTLAAYPFFLLAGLVFARTHGTVIGLTVTLMLIVALAGQETTGASQVQSDLGFASLVWGVIFLLDRGWVFTWPRVVAVFALACAAMAYRYLGVALVPAVALYALANSGHHARRLFVPTAIWAIGAVAVTAIAGLGIITSQFAVTPAQIWRAVPSAWQTYSLSAVEAHLYPFPWNPANDLFHVVTLSVTAVGLSAWTRTSWRSATWMFTAMYLLLLVVAFNRAGRYLMPLFPVLIFGLLHGGRVLVNALLKTWTSARASTWVAGSGAVVALAALIVMCVETPRTGGYLHEVPEATALFAHLSDQPEGETRVAFTEPRVLSWRTGVPATAMFNGPAAESIAELDRLGITHVVLNRIGLEGGRVASMRTTIAAYPCRFEPTFDNGSFEVYRLLPPCEESAPS
ncbi:MAG: hypothetical protein WEB90_05530 [Gemmatimonadota bacterium]